MSAGRLRNIHLLFVGSGELEREMRQSCHVVYDAERAGLQAPESSLSATSPGALPPASFAGFLNQTEISRAYVAADCLVLPSDYGETWGLVVNEALASGLPCIVSDACGCAEDLAGAEFSFPMGNLVALANKLERFHSKRLNGPTQMLPSVDNSVSAIASAYFDLLKGKLEMTPVVSSEATNGMFREFVD
jgi:glycosyltransferase involved in cell wall biosynthesis